MSNEIERSYRIELPNGDVHLFPSLRTRSQWITENAHLFNDLPLFEVEKEETEEPTVAEVGYVNPSHYTNRKYEGFDVMRDTQGYERHIGYLEGCVIKYMLRWDKKHDDPLMDLRKAERYLQQLIKTIETEEEQQYAMASHERSI
jgi:hypothetical protein